MKIHMELSAQGLNMSPAKFDECFDMIADALYDCAGIENADLSGDSSTQIATFSMDIEAKDEIEAFGIGLTAVRTALHVSGGSTPGWEKHFSLLRQSMETEAGAQARDLIDA